MRSRGGRGGSPKRRRMPPRRIAPPAPRHAAAHERKNCTSQGASHSVGTPPCTTAPPSAPGEPLLLSGDDETAPPPPPKPRGDSAAARPPPALGNAAHACRGRNAMRSASAAPAARKPASVRANVPLVGSSRKWCAVSRPSAARHVTSKSSDADGTSISTRGAVEEAAVDAPRTGEPKCADSCVGCTGGGAPGGRARSCMRSTRRLAVGAGTRSVRPLSCADAQSRSSIANVAAKACASPSSCAPRPSSARYSVARMRPRHT